MSMRRDWRSNKSTYKRKGPKPGPDDYLSPEQYKKIIESKPKDEKADAEWRRGLLLSMKANKRR